MAAAAADQGQERFTNSVRANPAWIFRRMNRLDLRHHGAANRQEEEGENRSSTPPRCLCMYSINPFTAGKYYSVCARGRGENKQARRAQRRRLEREPAHTHPPHLPPPTPRRPRYVTASISVSRRHSSSSVLTIVRGGHLSTVRLLSSEEVNTASELWSFSPAVARDCGRRKAATEWLGRK